MLSLDSYCSTHTCTQPLALSTAMHLSQSSAQCWHTPTFELDTLEIFGGKFLVAYLCGLQEER